MNPNKDLQCYKDFKRVISDSIILGSTLSKRINEYHYTSKTIDKINFVINWFYENYNKEIYSLRLKYLNNKLWVEVNDKYLGNLPFVVYYIKNNKSYISIDDTEMNRSI